MNHLAHLALAGDDLLIGSFLGDYVKGRLDGSLPPEVERGVRLHRAIDAFTDRHDIVSRSARRFDPVYRRYAGIMIDVVYDYFLARHWDDYYDSPLPEFSRKTLARLAEGEAHLTDRALRTVRRMQQHNALAHYGSESFLAGAFESLAGRLSRANPLAQALEQCLAREKALREDFIEFYPALIAFSENWRQNS